MNKLMNFLDRKIAPAAIRLSEQRHMSAIKNGFIAMLPITLVGSMAVLLNVFVRDIPTAMNGGTPPPFTEAMQWLITINGAVWWGSLAMMALIFAFALGYNLCKNSNVDPLPGGITALAIFLVTVPQVAVIPEGATLTLADGSTVTTLWGYLNDAYLSATGLFNAMITVLVFMELYVWLIKKRITIKMPESVPSNVANAFTAVIPAFFAIFASATVAYFIFAATGLPINDLISKFIMEPLMALGQGWLSVMFITLCSQTLWFFGIHGQNVLYPVYESIWGVAQNINISAYMAGEPIPYMWVRGSFDIYGMFGGGGVTLGLVISMFFFSKRPETKTIRDIALAPGIFNINEPLIFGVPMIMNAIYFVPFILTPLICMTIGYFATMIGFAGPVVAAVPWVTPVGLSAFLATGGSVGAFITSMICLVVSIIMYAPFVIMAEKQANKLYGATTDETK